MLTGFRAMLKRILKRSTLQAMLLLATTFAAGSLWAADVSLTELPREAKTTYALIKQGGPFPYSKDGTTFGNFEGNLPKKKRGYYREYTVPTPGAKNRGARRIVCGAGEAQWQRNAPDACFYTADHYQTFQKIKE